MKLKTDSPNKTLAILGIFVLSMFVMAAVNSACSKHAVEEQTEAADEGKVAMVEEGLNTCEGTVKFVHGSFLYIPEIVGFDVVLPAGVDASALEGRTVRLAGEFKRERPSVLTAVRIDIREGENKFTKFFEKTGDEAEQPFFNQHDRERYPALPLTTVNASEAWEGKGRGKVFGRFEKQSVTEGGVQRDVFSISVSDDKGKPLGKILVNNISDYALYSMKKLRLFDSFWFYLDIKESVEAKTRAKTKELFRADVVFTGLY